MGAILQREVQRILLECVARSSRQQHDQGEHHCEHE